MSEREPTLGQLEESLDGERHDRRGRVPEAPEAGEAETTPLRPENILPPQRKMTWEENAEVDAIIRGLGHSVRKREGPRDAPEVGKAGWQEERRQIISALGIEWDDLHRGWWVPAQPGPILCATIPEAIRATLSLAPEPAIPLTPGSQEAEPTKVDQRPNGCWFACIATLTGIPLDILPQVPEDASDEWFEENRARLNNETHAILRQHGWFMVHLWRNVPRGFAIAGGTSPRGVPHSVVVRDGELWHDPHVSRAGLVGIETFDVPVSILAPPVSPNRGENSEPGSQEAEHIGGGTGGSDG